MSTRRRASAAGLAALAGLGLTLALVPARAQQIHRHTFSGRSSALVRGDANVRVEEKEHDVSGQHFRSQPSSEHVKLVCDAGTGDAAFIHYFYETPPAPVTEALSAGVWVRATKPGLQLRARVVFPKEPDPARPEAALTMLVVGDTYDQHHRWQRLTLGGVPGLVAAGLPAVQAKVGRAVNTAGAYVDRLVLNLYAGPGPLEAWVDDLDVGPVQPAARPDGPAPATPVKNPKAGPAAAGLRQVEQRGGQLLVDNRPHFFRAIRHTGTPLHVLRAAGFDAVWLPADAPDELVAEAGREGWLVVPAAPPAPPTEPVAVDPQAVARRGDQLAGFLRKYAGSDVLFWDVGGGLTRDMAPQVQQTAEALRFGNSRRVLGGDLWDGFAAYAGDLQVVGAHRWPLFTSLPLPQYRDWLAQRRRLTAGSPAVFWTWVQDHVPEWYTATVLGRDPRAGDPPAGFGEPVGPHPEQVRLLAYIGVACGCRGLGFWSDRALADSHQGRDRLQGMALLNTELDMLAPVLLAPGVSGDRTQWLDTNHPNVKAAVVRGERGLLVLPIWLGAGTQYVPEQGAVPALKVVVPMVPDGADPWRVTPAGVEPLRGQCLKVNGGTELTIPEFDLVAPVVFTNDLAPNGLVVWWQDHARKFARPAALWSLDLAAESYEKVLAVHHRLAAAGARVPGAEALLTETHRYYREAQKHFANELYKEAYQDAQRALRPLRVLMRDHWQQAVGSLDLPAASPYAVSFYSLPRHWELFAQVQAARAGASVLPHGDFEFADDIPATGVRVDGLPGWAARAGTLPSDRVVVAAGVVPAAAAADPPRKPKDPPPLRGPFAPSRPVPPPDGGYLPQAPDLGKGVLRLEVRPTVELNPKGEPVPRPPLPLERTFLAVESPPVRLPPGTLVRVSGWVKVPADLQATADGALLYDDAGGEPLAVRVLHTRYRDEGVGSWRKFHLYRKVPATGQLTVTLALTGIGVAFFDDVRVEPLTPDPAASARVAARPGPGAAPTTPAARPTGTRPAVVPAGYRPNR